MRWWLAHPSPCNIIDTDISILPMTRRPIFAAGPPPAQRPMDAFSIERSHFYFQWLPKQNKTGYRHPGQSYNYPTRGFSTPPQAIIRNTQYWHGVGRHSTFCYEAVLPRVYHLYLDVGAQWPPPPSVLQWGITHHRNKQNHPMFCFLGKITPQQQKEEKISPFGT